jgi:hypothetical protein
VNNNSETKRLSKLTLDSKQKKVVEKITSAPTMAALNGSAMGTGKTLVATEVALGIDSKTRLIIAPLGTYWGWYDTIQRQTNYASSIVRIDSSKAGKDAFTNLLANKSGWYFVGREYFRTLDWSKIKPDIVIVDEVHAFQNRNSKGFKTLMKLQPKFKLALSGTPFGNKFEGAWAITRWLFPATTPKSFWAWVKQWCLTTYSPFSQVEIIGEAKPGEYAKSLPCYVRLEADDKLQTVTEVRYVELAPAQRKLYNKFERDLVVFLNDNPMIAEVPVAARIRLRQITLAVPSIDNDGTVHFEENAQSSKYKALKEIISDNPEDKMLILTDSQKYAKIVVSRLNGSSAEPLAFEWSGNANQTQREEAKQRFIKGKLQYIVAVIPAIAEGVDGLQEVCSTVVWLSHSDSNVLNEQVLDRIRRRGQKEVVKVYDIIARDTFDDPQLETLITRQLEMNKSLRKGENNDNQ